MKTTKNIFLALLAVLLSPMAANAVPVAIDVGVIGTEGDFTFDSSGSTYEIGDDSFATLPNVDTEMAIWTEGGILLAADDDGITFGGASEIMISLLAGTYIIGISEYDSVFENNFVNSFSAFEFGEIANLFLNINGAFAANGYAGDVPDLQENLFFQVEVVAASVPEPGTLALLGLGLVGMAARSRKTV